MTDSYPYIYKVTPRRRLRRCSAAQSMLLDRKSITCAKRELTYRRGLMFIASLFMAAATIDAAPVIAVIALGIMAWSVEQIRREEMNGR